MRAEKNMKPPAACENILASGLVTSKQSDVHARLETCVRRHLQTPWLQPLHLATMETYRRLEQEEVFSAGQPLILDSGCGTGISTQRLAGMFPHHLVVGVDRSLSRLAKSGVTSGFLRRENYILLRGELATFWRLLFGGGVSPERHFLFYPNPSPKPGHLSRRWHGHPVFPTLLALGGEIEMRCNWKIYAEEFAQAARYATLADIAINRIRPDDAISPFEQKYLERGQALFSVTIPARETNIFRLSWQQH